MVDLSLRSNFDYYSTEIWLSVQERSSNERIRALNSMVFVCKMHHKFNGAKLGGGPRFKGFRQASSIGAHALLQLVESNLRWHI